MAPAESASIAAGPALKTCVRERRVAERVGEEALLESDQRGRVRDVGEVAEAELGRRPGVGCRGGLARRGLRAASGEHGGGGDRTGHHHAAHQAEAGSDAGRCGHACCSFGRGGADGVDRRDCDGVGRDGVGDDRGREGRSVLRVDHEERTRTAMSGIRLYGELGGELQRHLADVVGDEAVGGLEGEGAEVAAAVHRGDERLHGRCSALHEHACAGRERPRVELEDRRVEFAARGRQRTGCRDHGAARGIDVVGEPQRDRLGRGCLVELDRAGVDADHRGRGAAGEHLHLVADAHGARRDAARRMRGSRGSARYRRRRAPQRPAGG